MDSHHDRGGLVGPILLIGLGLVFLLTNLGMLSTSIWGVLLRIWPVILIAIGVDLGGVDLFRAVVAIVGDAIGIGIVIRRLGVSGGKLNFII